MNENSATLIIHTVKDLQVTVHGEDYENMKRVLVPEMAEKIDLLRRQLAHISEALAFIGYESLGFSSGYYKSFAINALEEAKKMVGKDE